MFDIYARFPVWLWPVGPIILVWSFYIVSRITGQQRGWPRVNGIITESRIEKHRAQGIGRLHWVIVKVKYHVQGRDYRATFQWDTGISLEQAQEIAERYPDQAVTSLEYARYDPSIVRLRFSKVNNETILKYGLIGGVGVVLTILTLLAIAGNLPVPEPVIIVVTATAVAP